MVDEGIWRNVMKDSSHSTLQPDGNSARRAKTVRYLSGIGKLVKRKGGKKI